MQYADKRGNCSLRPAVQLSDASGLLSEMWDELGDDGMNAVKELDEARESSSDDDRVNAFGRLLAESGLSDAELEATIGLLSFAFRQRLEEKGASSDLSRCSFCHRSQREVKSLVVATEAAICNECVEIARATLQPTQPAQKRSWFSRV